MPRLTAGQVNVAPTRDCACCCSRFLVFAALLLLVVRATPALAQGRLAEVSFYSDALGEMRTFDIYLPAGYDPLSGVRYPVVYFLHGLGVTQKTYSGGIFLGLNFLIGMKLIEPLIMVMPDGRAPPYGGSFYTNSTLYGNLEDYIVDDLVSYVDEHYSSLADRRGRVIAGHSMGGYGAMKLAFKHPAVFRGAVSHSGPLDLARVKGMIPDLLAEYEEAPYEFRDDAGFYSEALFSMAGAFSPAPVEADAPVELPVDREGRLVEPVLDRWMMHNPAILARALSQSSGLALFFDCGVQDERGLYAWNASFADSLSRLGLPFEFQSYEGGHSDKLTERLFISIQYVDSLFAAPTAITVQAAPRPPAFQLEPNYPNPFNAATAIPFSLSCEETVRLEVYSALGRRVAILVDRRLRAGRHTVHWDASGLASGVYLCRLEAGAMADTRRLLLLK